MKKLVLLMTLIVLTQFAQAGEIIDAIAQSSDLKVQVLKDGRKIVASKTGLTLYTFDNDTTGISTCFDGCAKVWPAIETIQDQVPAPFKITLRPDGKKQISLENQPLYFFANDQKPGDIKGDNLGGIWHIVVIDE
ncbi:MAG: hypothetical protein QE271_14005 [Bacteriovoracaceae bacterium]|nr:hypothetical protein [Bacteriovoracaceae bacterium]